MEITVSDEVTYNIKYAVFDFNGTIALDGDVLPGVKEKFAELKDAGVQVYVITADTYQSAAQKLHGYDCEIKIIGETKQAEAKQLFIQELGAHHVCAIGNGWNDQLMLRDAALGIAVIASEGCAREAMNAADIIVTNILHAFDLFAKPKRLRATLRGKSAEPLPEPSPT